jgi:hypothetical protein
MRQTHDEITQNLAERLCWEVARRDGSRLARRLYRKQAGGRGGLPAGRRGGVGRFLPLPAGPRGTGTVGGGLRHRHPAGDGSYVQYVLLYGLKTLFGIESMHALPPVVQR